MSELSDAFNEAIDSAAEVKGSREFVILRGKSIEALIFDQTDELVPAAGGYADPNQFLVSIRRSDVPLPIRNLTKITIRGKELYVLSYKPLEGRIDITAGDLAEEVE